MSSRINFNRPKTSKARNIHTLSLNKKRSLKDLKKISLKKNNNVQLSNNIDYFECRDLINIHTIANTFLPKTAKVTPTYGFHDDVSETKSRETPHSDLSDESGSLYYPNEPRIHVFSEIEIKKVETSLKDEKHSTKKIFIKNPKIVITTKEVAPKEISPKEVAEKKFQFPYKNNYRYSSRPVKDISELIFSHNKTKPKGRVRRGLCINSNKSPIPRVLHNIKLAV